MHHLPALLSSFTVIILLPAWSLMSCCKCFRKKSKQSQIQTLPPVSPMSVATVPENKTPEQIIKSGDQSSPNVVPAPQALLPSLPDQVKSNKSKVPSAQFAPVVTAPNVDKIPEKLKAEPKVPIVESKEAEKKVEAVSNRTAELFMSSAAIRRQRDDSVKKKKGSGFYATESQADEDDTLEEYPDPEQEKTEDNMQSKSKRPPAKKTRKTEVVDLKTAESKQ